VANRHTLEQDIDEILGARTAGAGPRDIDWGSAPATAQAFEDMRDFPEEPEDSDEEGSEDDDDPDDDA